MPPLSAAQQKQLRTKRGLDDTAIVNFSGTQYGFLSSFWRTPVMLDDGVMYKTAEHAFQAQKATNAADRARIASAAEPAGAKAIGRKVAKVPGWFGEGRKEAMRKVLAAKFVHGSELAELLLQTGSRQLVEGNTWNDQEWGVTLDGVGLNMLGEMLMERRSELAADKAKAVEGDTSTPVAEQKPKPKRKPAAAAAEDIELLESDSEEPSPAAKPRAKRQQKVAPEAVSS